MHVQHVHVLSIAIVLQSIKYMDMYMYMYMCMYMVGTV